MEKVEFNGWKNNVRLANDEIELIVTHDVGPRVIRCGFRGEKNLFAEIAGQQGGEGEGEWMIRGGHRLWVAPEAAPQTYELDNVPIEIEETETGIRTRQAAGKLTGISKSMEIGVLPDTNEVHILHHLKNEGTDPVELSVWALSVMAVGGMAVIPMPAKISHTDRLTHNKEWSLWGYTDFTDPRWTLGSRYIFFRQDTERGPNKLGIAHREGWVAYLLDEFMFVKRFRWMNGATYPDGGVNFETFSNEEFLELESLGPMTCLKPGESVAHEEVWSLYRGIEHVETEGDADRLVRAVAAG